MALDLISTIQAFMWKRDLPLIDLHLIFKKSSLKNQVWKIKLDELDFLSILNSIFTACVACKIQAWNKQKIQFIQLNFSNWIFQKSSADQ